MTFIVGFLLRRAWATFFEKSPQNLPIEERTHQFCARNLKLTTQPPQAFGALASSSCPTYEGADEYRVATKRGINGKNQ